MNNHKQPKGFTLIELLLVFAVIIGLVLASYRRYQQYTLEKDIAAVKQNVALLLDGANAFYSSLLLKPKPNNPVYKDDDLTEFNFNNTGMVFNKFWPKNLLKSNLVKDLSPIFVYKISASRGIKIDTPEGQPQQYTHQLIVTVTLNPAVVNKNNIDWYQQELGASESSADQYNNQFLIWKQLPGYSIKGISSDLWMLEGGLRTFKKALEEQSGS